MTKSYWSNFWIFCLKIYSFSSRIIKWPTFWKKCQFRLHRFWWQKFDKKDFGDKNWQKEFRWQKLIERILETKIATNIEAVVWGLTLTCYNIYQKKKIPEIFENFQKINHLNIFFLQILDFENSNDRKWNKN